MRFVLLAVTLVLAPLPFVVASLPDHEAPGLAPAVTAPIPVGRITFLVSPLPAFPSFARPGDALLVETSEATTSGSLSATLASSFGSGAPIALGTVAGTPAASPTWPGRTTHQFLFTLPAGTPEDLYDLRIASGARTDEQPRAVKVVASYAARPRIAIVGDPQVGDPRAMQDAFTDAFEANSPQPILDVGEKTMFAFPGAWPAMSDAIAQINDFAPDFVLVTGDVTFGQDAPGKYLAEYETAWEVMNEFRVPTFLSLGNHDGYVQGELDGFELWQKYFGPLYTSRDYGPSVHIVALNTYDWSEMDRMAVAAGVSAWGGQMRADQLAWLAADLAAFRQLSPTGLVFTFAHHNPSWIQDVWPYYGAGNGVPVVEQVARGAISFGTTDQGWSGDNRLAVRDLLRTHDVTVRFAGHTHRDRVARDDAGHGVVETTQKPLPGMTAAQLRELHYVFHDGTWGAANQTELGTKLSDWSLGPFYVDTTTAASDTSLYWGWRPVNLTDDGAGGFVLSDFGWTPPSQAWLDTHTRSPANWGIGLAAHGLYSRPTYPDGL